MITHMYEEYPEVVAAAKQALDDACNRGEASCQVETLEMISVNLSYVEMMLRGIRETFTARTGATLDANTVEYLDAQLSMIQDSVRASLHLSDLTRGQLHRAAVPGRSPAETTCRSSCDGLRGWPASRCCTMTTKRSVNRNDHAHQHRQMDGDPLAHRCPKRRNPQKLLQLHTGPHWAA